MVNVSTFSPVCVAIQRPLLLTDNTFSLAVILDVMASVPVLSC